MCLSSLKSRRAGWRAESHVKKEGIPTAEHTEKTNDGYMYLRAYFVGEFATHCLFFYSTSSCTSPFAPSVCGASCDVLPPALAVLCARLRGMSSAAATHPCAEIHHLAFNWFGMGL